MKRIQALHGTLLVLLFAGLGFGCSTARQAPVSGPDSAFKFEVQTVNPLNGSSRQITGDYGLHFSKTALRVDLPYFGRSYSAPVNPSEGGIKLNTDEFRYEVNEKRKGWELVIRPDNQRDVQMMVLSVSESGFGTLQVTSTNRQSISYYGRVQQRDMVNN